jgi:hypothetical protein
VPPRVRGGDGLHDPLGRRAPTRGGVGEERHRSGEGGAAAARPGREQLGRRARRHPDEGLDQADAARIALAGEVGDAPPAGAHHVAARVGRVEAERAQRRQQAAHRAVQQPVEARERLVQPGGESRQHEANAQHAAPACHRVAAREAPERPGPRLLVAAERHGPSAEHGELQRARPAASLARHAPGEGERGSAFLLRRRAVEPPQQHLTHFGPPRTRPPRGSACL